ncbi:MAG: GFA family protein [Pseudomonadota bacterium]
MAVYGGSCLCGALKFTVEVPKSEFHVCHCGMCRRWHGGPALMVMADHAPRFEADAALGVYRSSDWGERCFCSLCGTSLLWRSVDGRFQAVPVGVLDGVEDFVFTMEIFVDDKPGSYAFAGDHEMMTGAEVMAAFGDETSP